MQTTQKPEDQFACAHYKRKCKFVTPCCDGLYRCRFCHDEEQRHTLKREDVRMVECSECGERQGVVEKCRKCGTQFGKYFCYECKLYDDEEKQQFHCTGCGICRVGGRANYFHCSRCDMCLPNHLRGAHNCVEKASRVNCPVCQEDIHTSRMPSQIPLCNHLIHKNCFDQMLTNGYYACPICYKSLIPMGEIWKTYDKEIAETPMPDVYANLYASIQCRDCRKTGLSSFHVLGMKCGDCGSYNTVREKGPLVRLSASGTPVEEDLLRVFLNGENEGEVTLDITAESGEEALDLLDGEVDSQENPEDALNENEEESDSGTDSSSDEESETESGPVRPPTPPETPMRQERLRRSASSETAVERVVDSSVVMTPEPSPMRDIEESSERREAPVTRLRAVRRIVFPDNGSDAISAAEDEVSHASDALDHLQLPPTSSAAGQSMDCD